MEGVSLYIFLLSWKWVKGRLTKVAHATQVGERSTLAAYSEKGLFHTLQKCVKADQYNGKESFNNVRLCVLICFCSRLLGFFFFWPFLYSYLFWLAKIKVRTLEMDHNFTNWLRCIVPFSFFQFYSVTTGLRFYYFLLSEDFLLFFEYPVYINSRVQKRSIFNGKAENSMWSCKRRLGSRK